MNQRRRKYRVRYGLERIVTDNGHGIYTIEGEAHHCRVSDTMFDAEGGVLDDNALYIGYDYGFGKINEIFVEKAEEGKFKIRVEVEE